MAIFDQYTTDPAGNNRTPPNGAPEGGLTYERISDTLRVVMAALAELREATVAKLKGMAFQAPDAVAITGGVISNVSLTNVSIPAAGNVIATDTAKFAGLTLQQLYNAVHPVGDAVLRRVDAPPLWPGITATWEKRHSGRFPRMATNAGTAGAEGGAASVAIGGSGTTASAGAHTHAATAASAGGGTTGGTSLSSAQVPSAAITSLPGSASLLVADAGAYPNGTPRRLVTEPTADNSHSHTLAAHSHAVAVASDGAHAHGFSIAGTVPLDPLHFTLHCWVRTA